MNDTFNKTFLENLTNKKEIMFWKRALKINPKKGLTTALARRSNILYGPNKLSVKGVKTLWAQILEHFKELITILLCVAAILSFLLGILAVIQHPSDTTEYISLFLESLIICAIIFTNIFLSIKQSDKTDKALQTLKDLVVPMAKVVRNGRTKLLPSANIVPGDIMVLEAGESVAADAKLIEAVALKIDEAILTGESMEVDKDASYESDEKQPIGDRKDWVFSGTAVTNGTGLCQVFYTGMNTQVGQIAKLLDAEAVDLTPLQKQIAKLSKIIGIVAVSICLVTFILYMVAMTGFNGFYLAGWSTALNVSISLAIASIPETLLAVVSIILSIAVQRMSKQNALIKRLPAIETLGNVSIVCSDKTGTLTKNIMTVVRTWSPKFPLQTIDARKPDDPNINLYKYGSLCSDVKMYKERGRVKYIGDSTETAIVKGLVKQGIDFEKFMEKFPRLGEIPFDSDRKMMSVIVDSDDPKYKYMAIIKGAPDRVFKKLRRSKENNVRRAGIVNNEFGNDALRVLAVGVRYFNHMPKEILPKNIEHKLDLVGLFGIIDPPKPEARVAVQELKRAGIRTIMITGDHKTTAAAIAKELKILRPGQEVISGAELDLMSDEDLIQNVDKYSVYARVSPNDKLRIVKAWKANGKIVSMTGDGVNDAPSLKAASVGCAMGITGTDVAKDSSDMVLVDDNFATIVRAIDSGRRVMLNIKSALSMMLTANLANLLCIFVGILIFYISPLKSLQILFINIAIQTLLSFGIARNSISEDVMMFKPKNQKEFIIDKRMLVEIVFFGTLIAAASLAMFWIGATFTNEVYYYNFYRFALDAKAYGLGEYTTIGSTTYLYPSIVTSAGIQYPSELCTQAQFLASYHYGSMLCFLTIGLGLALNGLYARQKGSVFKQKFKDARFMLLIMLSGIAMVCFVAFTPGVSDIFNMNIYNTNILQYANYNAYLGAPFAAFFGFMIFLEIYRLIYTAFFNPDGSRKIRIKGKVDDDDDENDGKPHLRLSELMEMKEKKKLQAQKNRAAAAKARSANAKAKKAAAAASGATPTKTKAPAAKTTTKKATSKTKA